MNVFTRAIAGTIAGRTGVPAQTVIERLERPPNPAMGDYAFPCFVLSREMRKPPPVIARELAAGWTRTEGVERVEAVGAYLNAHLQTPALAAHVLPQVLAQGERYGAGGSEGTVVVDFSSPNIAKPFHVGHLRTTVLGHSLARILGHLGYTVVRVNHLGDWGTQFGLLLYGYGLWGDEGRLAADPIRHLVEIYVRASEEAEKDPAVQEAGRALFRRLELGDPDVRAVWQRFRDLSIERFKVVYDQLGIDFDRYDGESFYVDRMEAAIARLAARGLTVESEGALVVPLDELKLPPAILRKSDDASSYLTRDLAAALYRLETYDPVKVVYVVGAPQTDHFRALFALLEKLDPALARRFVHVSFGHYRFADRSMSTRRGDVVELEDLVAEGIEKARAVIRVKNPDLEAPETVARQVAIGALIYGDLSTDRVKDLVFDWGTALSFDGDTGPYVQNAYVRTAGIVRKMAADGISFDPASIPSGELGQPSEHRLLVDLLGFRETLEAAAAQYKPHLLAGHLLELARDFHRFYHDLPVLKAPAGVREARVALVCGVAAVLRRGLWLLGIEAPERM